MIALRTIIHVITDEPVDRDTRRARLLAATRKPIGSITRRGILSGHWEKGGASSARSVASSAPSIADRP